MTIDRKALASVVAALLLVAACGGSASQSPSSAPSQSAEPAASQPAASAAATSGVVPSLVPGAVADLEAKLPSSVNGVAFTKTSFDGSSLPATTPIGTSELETFLKDNGKSLQDVKVAIATPTDTSSTATGSVIMAIQVQGVDQAKLQQWASTQMGDTSATKQTIGGKEVYGAGAAGMGAYFYVKDDVIYYVLSLGGQAGMAEAIISALP